MLRPKKVVDGAEIGKDRNIVETMRRVTSELHGKCKRQGLVGRWAITMRAQVEGCCGCPRVLLPRDARIIELEFVRNVCPIFWPPTHVSINTKFKPGYVVHQRRCTAGVCR